MNEVFQNHKKKILASCFLVLLVGIGIYHVLSNKNTKENLAAQVKPGQCVVQYNTCAFVELKNDPWERGCEPVFRSFETIQVGDKKVLFKDLSNSTQAVFPKNMIRKKASVKEDANANSVYLYVSDCDKAKPVQISAQKEESKPAVEENDHNFMDLSDKCIVLENDCTHSERWEEDQKYCHPFKNSYKVLEAGVKSLRVVTWHGHGQTNSGRPITVGTESNLSKEEYLKLGYKENDCSELVSKYNKNFSSVRGK